MCGDLNLTTVAVNKDDIVNPLIIGAFGAISKNVQRLFQGGLKIIPPRKVAQDVSVDLSIVMSQESVTQLCPLGFGINIDFLLPGLQLLTDRPLCEERAEDRPAIAYLPLEAVEDEGAMFFPIRKRTTIYIVLLLFKEILSIVKEIEPKFQQHFLLT